MNVCLTPTQYDEVCINTTTGSVSRLENCTSSGLTEFNPVMSNGSPCGIGKVTTQARCRVYHPQGDDPTCNATYVAPATAAAKAGVNTINCRNCRLVITVTRPGNGTVAEFVIKDLEHFTYTNGPTNPPDPCKWSFIYFSPLALENAESSVDVTAWTNNLNGLLNAGDVFNLSLDAEGGVTTDDALALTFIHGRDTRTNDNGITWERNRAGISSRDYTVWVSLALLRRSL